MKKETLNEKRKRIWRMMQPEFLLEIKTDFNARRFREEILSKIEEQDKQFIKDILEEIDKSKYSSEARWDIYLKNKIKENSGFEDLK